MLVTADAIHGAASTVYTILFTLIGTPSLYFEISRMNMTNPIILFRNKAWLSN